MSKLTQVVSGNGDFKEDEVENFIRENGVETAGLDYQVIAYHRATKLWKEHTYERAGEGLANLYLNISNQIAKKAFCDCFLWFVLADQLSRDATFSWRFLLALRQLLSNLELFFRLEVL